MKEDQLNNDDGKVTKGFTLGIRYVLPSGTVRYHCDSWCTTSTDEEDTKPHFSKQNILEEAFTGAQKWLDRVKANFKYIFTGKDEEGEDSPFPSFKDHPLWEGAAFEDIKIELFHLVGKLEADYKVNIVSINVINGEVVTAQL